MSAFLLTDIQTKEENLLMSGSTAVVCYIEVLEDNLGKKAIKNLLPLQPGDVPDTFANVDDLVSDLGYKPDTPIEVGIKNFVEWYREYYKI